MNVEEFDNTPPAMQAVLEKVDALGEQQTTLFETVALFVEHRSHAAANQLTKDGENMRQAFYEVVEAALSSKELPRDERYKIAASTYVEVKEKRMSMFSQLSPDGVYEIEETYDEILENIQDYSNSEYSDQDIALELTNAYILDYTEDLDGLMCSLAAPRKEKVKYMAREVGRHAFDIGKVSAAVVIGTLLARKITQDS